MSKEVEEFFADLPKDNLDNLGANGQQVATPTDSQTGNDDKGKPSSDGENNQNDNEIPFHKNPRWKKMVADNRELSEKLEKLSELEKFNKDTKGADDAPPIEWTTLYGDDDKAINAWKIQRQREDKLMQQAEERAYGRLRSDLDREKQEEKQWGEYINDQFEDIEDTHKIDLTSNAPSAQKTRKEFLGLVQKLSPKDKDGNIESYADFGQTWEIYQSMQSKPDNSQRKSIASRSMAKSSDSTSEPEGYVPGMGFGAIDHLINP